MREMDPVHVCILARNKDRTLRFRVSPEWIPAMTERLIASGATAMRDGPTAAAFGISDNGVIAEGYNAYGDSPGLIETFGLVSEPGGNAVAHEATLIEPFADGKIPIAAIAVDLMASVSTRERSAGQRVLRRLLNI